MSDNDGSNYTTKNPGTPYPNEPDRPANTTPPPGSATVPSAQPPLPDADAPKPLTGDYVK
jgi:hypothetical protein